MQAASFAETQSEHPAVAPAESRKRLAACLGIFLLALGLRFGLVVARGDYQRINHEDQSKVALALLKKGEFADPYILPTGPTAHYAPAHPFLLSLVYRAFGDGVTGEMAKQAMACAFSAATYSVMPVVTHAFGFGLPVGIGAGIAGALLPLKFETETKGEWEAPEAALLLILLSILSYRRLTRQPRGLKQAAMAGLAWGGTLYVAPQLLPVFVAFLALEILRAQRRRVRAVYACGVIVAVAGLAVSPWIARNYFTLGRLVFMRDALPLALYVSHRDGAAVRITDNYPPEPYAVHPSTSRKEADEVRAAGEGAYMGERQRRAVAWIFAHPGMFAYLTAARFGYFWFHWTGVLLKDGFFWAVTLASFAGLRRAWRSNQAAAVLFAAIWIAYPAAYYFI